MHVTLIVLLFLLQAVQSPDAVGNSGNRPAPPAAKINPTFGQPNPETWDSVYSNPTPGFNTAPNAFMTQVVKGLKPGRALDIGMGQGRNSIYLAKLGWDVSGIDISETGMEAARKSAKAAGVKITTIKASMDDFEFGAGQWDLIVATYEGASWLERAAVGLKPGGYVIVETFGKSANAPVNAGFGPNELPKLFMDRKLQILHYEDVDAKPDWSNEIGRVVRVFARKSE